MNINKRLKKIRRKLAETAMFDSDIAELELEVIGEVEESVNKAMDSSEEKIREWKLKGTNNMKKLQRILDKYLADVENLREELEKDLKEMKKVEGRD